MTDCARSARYWPEDRLAGIAAILATGLLRLESQAALPTNESRENPPKRRPEGLELSRQTRLSVRCG
jgi:hypothetical protein